MAIVIVYTDVYTNGMGIVWDEDDRFVWDKDKHEANYLEHGILFEDIAPIFFSPAVYFSATKKEHGEERAIAISSIEGLTVVVVFTERERKIRLISARIATRKERARLDKFRKQMRRFFEY